MTTDTISFKDRILADFQIFENGLNGQSSSALHALRQHAISVFAEHGFPTTKHEEWKYANLAPALKADYALRPNVEDFTVHHVSHFPFASLKTYATVVFVNGVYSEDLSVLPDSDEEIRISSLVEFFRHSPECAAEHFGKYADLSEPMTALNTAFVRDGIALEIPDGVSIAEPIHFLFLADAHHESVFVQPRLLVLLGKSSSATFLESYGTWGKKSAMTNSVAEFVLAEKANANITIIQNDEPNSSRVASTYVSQAGESVFSATTLTVGGAFTRNNLTTVLNGERAESHFYGLSVLDESQIADNHSLVDHAQPNCESNELYKHILDGKSVGVFNGKIMVRRDAQKTNAYQSNKTIFLSPTATINSKPQLEIFADDVKCSHGATSGRLDDEAMFYLRSRGVSKEQAQAMLTAGFAEEIVGKIPMEEVREKVEAIVAERLEKKLG